jgi:hypothetical protein
MDNRPLQNHESAGRLSEFKGSKFKVAPHVDQTQVYNAVFKRLQTDGYIGIFPEGGSHDRPKMLPLKGKNLSLHGSYDTLLISTVQLESLSWHLVPWPKIWMSQSFLWA